MVAFDPEQSIHRRQLCRRIDPVERAKALAKQAAAVERRGLGISSGVSGAICWSAARCREIVTARCDLVAEEGQHGRQTIRLFA